jgi:glyoxylate reductase
MARVLVSTPMLEGCLEALAGHELIGGPPGSDGAAEALLCAPAHGVDALAQARMPRLRAIAVAGAGSDAVDVAFARSRGVPVLTAGEPLVETTADLAFGLVIAACRRFHDAESTLRAGAWEGLRFMEEELGGRDVHRAALGLVGYGAIGRAVGRRARAFGMQVRHHTRTDTGTEGWVEDLDELLAGSEIVSVHVPLTEDTRGLIDRRRIGLLRPDAVLVNTARGAVVDEDALAEALVDGRLFAAGLDVYAREPEVSPALLAAPRTVLLPHVGSATERTRRAMLRGAAEKLAEVLAESG